MITKATPAVTKILLFGKVCRGIGGTILRFGKSYLAYDAKNKQGWFYYQKRRQKVVGRMLTRLSIIHELGPVPF